ncbi:MAG TPA: tetratricopeptide repeat-containing protein [Pyrinomonadaceae bacterium]|nr:tetratricopeptide repeat-containing protein [Pyrinomonadaceae bacterium]
MNKTSPAGKIITFYSYKGGTGRSMALANVAWVLAANGRRVLVLDWDLEAPGLHRYFRPFIIDKQLQASDGLIDFVLEFADAAITPAPAGESLEPDWYFSLADITRFAISINFSGFPTGGSIDLIPAGRQGATYATRVNSFNWQNLYERLGGGALFEKAKSFMRENYDYILIDSRTGVSDTSGICTVQMPDALAICFTYNNQSIEGAAAIARSSREGRRAVASQLGATNFPIFPIPTRVEQAEQSKLRVRQKYARTHFEDLLDTSISRDVYWEAVEVPYVPFYGYEETLSAFSDNPSDPKHMLSAYIRIAQYLVSEKISFNFPVSEEEKRRIRREFAATGIDDPEEETIPANASSAIDEMITQAEAAFLKLDTTLQTQAPRVLTRMVRVAHSEDGGEHSRQRVRVKDLGDAQQLLAKLSSLVAMSLELTSGEDLVEFVHDAYVRNWPRLTGWVEENRDFLLWRQTFRDQLRVWETNGRGSGFFLQGEQLRTAVNWRDKQRDWLNPTENDFINRSLDYDVVPQSRAMGGRAFIIRPFGIKNEIDFDQVETSLIAPALRQLGMEGGTIEIVAAGNIRLDMFQRLLRADLIIADLSIHNANVFYELGIRHALRRQKTFIMRCDSDVFPFDLQTDRYFTYDRQNPGASFSLLVTELRRTLDSNSSDSPVFKSLPDLPEPDLSMLATVPPDFCDEVDLASTQKRRGDLLLLANEVRGFEWEVNGQRIIGHAQFGLKDFAGARPTWELIRQIEPLDNESNLILGTIYERLGDLTRSTQALKSILGNKDIKQGERAEAYSLLARNAKTRWQQTWSGTPFEERRVQALRSSFLQDSIDAYSRAFDEDLNHYYSGLNALALLTIRNELAKELPEVWLELFERDLEARLALEVSVERTTKLSASVEQSLQASQQRLKRESRKDIWTEIAAADLHFITTNRSQRIAAAYRDALSSAQVSDFAVDAVRRQATIYRDLGLFTDRVDGVFKVIGMVSSDDKPRSATPVSSQIDQGRILVFAGHMIDHANRSKPRFPADREQSARERIKEVVSAEMQLSGVKCGFAGGASGGDILFHEVCHDLGIPTELYLAFPAGKYVEMSVAPAGKTWVDRFWRLYERHEVEGKLRVLTQETDETRALPAWLRAKLSYGIWQRNNLWIFFNALAEGDSERVTFVTLWDGARDDGPGSISDMVEKAKSFDAKTIHIHTDALLKDTAS